MCLIAVNGAKGDISLTTITEDATAIISSRIVGDSAVSEDERSCIIIDATTALAARSATICAIARDSAVGESKRASFKIEDATTTEGLGTITGRSIVRDSAVGEVKPAFLYIKDAASAVA